MMIVGRSEAAIIMIMDAIYSTQGDVKVFNNLNLLFAKPYKIRGTVIDEVTEFSYDESMYAIGVGTPKAKMFIAEKYFEDITDERLPVIINYSSFVSNEAKFGKGCIIDALVSIAAHATLGKFVTVNANSSIAHHCNIGDFVTICPNAVIAGNVTIGEGTFIGAGAIIRDGITIGKNCVIGMGSVVLKDVPDNTTGYGNPFTKKK